MDAEKRAALEKALEGVDFTPVINLPTVSSSNKTVETRDPTGWLTLEEEDVDGEQEDILTPVREYIPREEVSGGDSGEFYAGKFGEGLVKGATFLPDATIQGLGFGMGYLARQMGFEDFAAGLENPLTVYDVVRTVWEAPQALEEAITGEDAKLTRGFDISPRQAETDAERLWGETAFFAGGAVSLPTALMKVFGYMGKSPKIQQLLFDAGSRGPSSILAQKYLGKAANSENIGTSLVALADQYALSVASRAAVSPVTTYLGEAGLGGLGGFGFALPNLVDDPETGKMMFDLGPGIGEVDLKPTLQILLSMGIPVGVSMTPAGLALNTAKNKAVPFLANAFKTIKQFSGDLFAGFHPGGRYNLASRVWMSLQDDPWAMEHVFIPAVESGLFKQRTITLKNDEVVPATGGLSPTTLQILESLGIEQPSIVAMNNFLRGKGDIAYARLTENKLRSEKLSAVLNDIKSRIDMGEDVLAYDFIKNTLDTLDDVAAKEVQKVLDDFIHIKNNLGPNISAEDLSTIAASLLDDAVAKSGKIEKKLWAPDVIGTDSVNATSLGDFAANVIQEAGRNIFSEPLREVYSIYFQLAGGTRLAGMKLTPTGNPILKEAIDGNVVPEDTVGVNGLFDIFGEGANASRVKINELQEYRSGLWDTWRKFKKDAKPNSARIVRNLIEHIDEGVLIQENMLFPTGDSTSYLTALQIARAYTKSQKDRFGPDTFLGKFINNPSSENAALLTKHLQAPLGERVKQWYAALNEPVRVESFASRSSPDDPGGVTWELDFSAPINTAESPNVIEAEILRRLVYQGGKDPTPDRILKFIKQYESAIDKVPGLREKLSDYETARAGIYAMSAKLTVPEAQQISAAIKSGATLDSIEHAMGVRLNILRKSQENTAATEFIGRDRNVAASEFIRMAWKDPGKITTRANELFAMLSLDESGQALRGFRGALFRALENAATPVKNIQQRDLQGDQLTPLHGMDPVQLDHIVNKLRPLLNKFYDPVQIQYFDEWLKGTKIADIERITQLKGGAPKEAVSGIKTAGTEETVAAAGRMGGQAGFGGILGINTLAAASTGRRLGVAFFRGAGEKKILDMVERAMRDQEFARELQLHFETLNKYAVGEQVVSGAARVRASAEAARNDPQGYLEQAKRAADAGASLVAGKVGNYLYDYSLHRIRRAVKFGLLATSEATTRIDLQTDYEMGRPFLYPENERRWEMENSASSYTPPNPPAPGTVNTGSQLTPLNMEDIIGLPAASTTPSPSASIPMPEANRASVLGQVNPFATPSRYTGQQVFGATDPIVGDFEGATLAAEGGIVSIKGKKPRQMVI